MSPNLATKNTSPTPDAPGRWVVTEFGKPDVLKWHPWDPTSEVSGNNVLVRIILAGLGGVDNIQRVGGFPDPRASKPGFSTGYEIVGEVLALGDSMDLKMLGTCSPSKFDYIRSLGVEPIDRNASDLVEQVRKLTDGAGVDVAYDGVCSEDSVRNFLAATKPDTGRLVVFGLMGEIASDGSKMLDGAQATLGRRLQQPRTSFFSLSQELHNEPEVDDFHVIVDKVRTGELDPVIAKLLPLSKGVEGHQLLVNGSAVKGKLLFVVDADLATKLGVQSDESR
ncbi:hypothetical protein FB567DRAFT_451667 [Paraphoma chrysanthemicola]|uniref:Alcohol dehydrogenase-like C-terminal domain-containing protein n=1 Tax=Paraphoma chrysanthemicola TaxID=798071 RepID=A0A8K0QWT5_9PLEO|nr:hypothetical protein FB567DRAFT_451667 [Paraphoma chrysanthemicola]